MELVHRLVGDHEFLLLTAGEVKIGDLLLLGSHGLRQVRGEKHMRYLGYRVLFVAYPGSGPKVLHQHQLLHDGVAVFGVLRPDAEPDFAGPLTAEDCIRALLQHGLDCTEGCSPGLPPVCVVGCRLMLAKQSLERQR